MKITKEGFVKFLCILPFQVAIEMVGGYDFNQWQWWLLVITAGIPVFVYEHYALQKVQRANTTCT